MPGERIGNSNQYLTISGVVSAPAYSWASDNDTGLYRIGADNIGVAANGAKVLDIATTGLTVTGAFASSNKAVINPAATPTTAATATQLGVGEATNNSTYRLNLGYWVDGGIYRGNIDAITGGTAATLTLNSTGGAVGIGMTPVRTLDVTGTGGFTGLLTANGGVKVTTTSATTDSFTNIDTNTGGKEWRFGATTASGGYFAFYNATDAVFGPRFTSTGAVTVGTSTVYNAAKISTNGKIAALGSFGSTKFTEQTGAGIVTLATMSYSNGSYAGAVKVKVFTNGTTDSNGGYAYEYSEWVVTYSSYGGNFQSPVITRNVQNQYSINGGVISCTTTITATGTSGTLTIKATPSSSGAAPYTAFRTSAQLEVVSQDYAETLT